VTPPTLPSGPHRQGQMSVSTNLPIDLLVNLQPGCRTDEFQVPIQFDLRDDTSIFVWVGHNGQEPSLTSLVLAHPNGHATVAIANHNSMSMDAALSAGKRLSKKFNRPILLSYPIEPLPNSNEDTFRILENGIIRELKEILEQRT
jgi:hypothetical protein